jgi:hypothetical protein
MSLCVNNFRYNFAGSLHTFFPEATANSVTVARVMVSTNQTRTQISKLGIDVDKVKTGVF